MKEQIAEEVKEIEVEASRKYGEKLEEQKRRLEIMKEMGLRTEEEVDQFFGDSDEVMQKISK